MLMLRRRLRSGAPWKSSLLLALLVATVALRTALASAADRSDSSPPTTSNEAAESGGGGEEVASELIYEALRALPNPVESLPTAQERLDMDRVRGADAQNLETEAAGDSGSDGGRGDRREDDAPIARHVSPLRAIIARAVPRRTSSPRPAAPAARCALIPSDPTGY